MRRKFLIFSLLSSLAFASTPTVAQDKQAIRLLVGFAAGGALDSVARAVAEQLRVTMDRPVIVENKPGAGQRVALGELKRSKPDGLTIMLSNNSPFTIFPLIYKKLEFDPFKDFTPIGQVAEMQLGIAVGPAAPPGDLKNLMAWAKANPNDATFAASAAGQMGHFIGEMLSNASGAPLTLVPYKGGAPGMTDLVGGHVPMMIDTIKEPMEMAKSGKIRILAVTGEKRLSILPDVPTIREAGFDASAEGYVGIYGPAGMSKETVAELSEALKTILSSKDLQDRIEQFAMTPAYSTPEELVEIQAAGLEKWKGPVISSGFQGD